MLNDVNYVATAGSRH